MTGGGRLFCFGFGYTARALAGLLPDGWSVAGTVRSADECGRLRRQGIDAAVFDGTAASDEAADLLAGATHVLSSVPPDREGDPVLRCFADELAAARNVKWLGYLSTTGVYGDHGGGWVDEDTPVTPTGPRGQRRADAEAGWLRLYGEHGRPVHIFRLPGIYGPGRSAIDNLRASTARRIVKPGQVFSRIHVEDLAATLLASMLQPNPGAIYNVCDDEPAPPQDVIAYAARLIGVEPPPETAFEEAELSDMARSFYAENKRVRNERIRRELGVELRYPTYREGLAAILAQE